MLWLVLGCTGRTPEPPDNVDGALSTSDPVGGSASASVSIPDDASTLEARLEALLALADAAGFDAQVGRYGFLSPNDCCLPDGDCYGNNPASPYGYAHLPPSPGQTSIDSGTEIDGARSAFRLREDEAVVLVGKTPPEVRYFGFRSHLAERLQGGERRTVLGTLGVDLSMHRIVRERATFDVFERPMAIVTTADAGIEQEVLALLGAAGFPDDEIHEDRIGAGLADLGLHEEADTISIIERVAVFADPALEARYRADPGIVPVRLTPRTPRPAALHPLEPLPPRGSGTDEGTWTEAVDALEAAILAEYPTFAVTVDTMTSKGVITYDCLEGPYTVCGDLSSRIFLRSPKEVMPSGSFAIAFGVNHQRSGKATYSSFAVQAYEHNVGLAAVESDEMPGSARAFLPGHPLVDDLYAVVVSRDCGDFPGALCIEVNTGCPGVEEDEELYIMARLYVDPISGAAPLESEILLDRAVRFEPEIP